MLSGTRQMSGTWLTMRWTSFEATGMPSISTDPESGLSSPDSIFTAVLLPLPFGPTSACTVFLPHRQVKAVERPGFAEGFYYPVGFDQADHCTYNRSFTI